MAVAICCLAELALYDFLGQPAGGGYIVIGDDQSGRLEAQILICLVQVSGCCIRPQGRRVPSAFAFAAIQERQS